MTPTSYSLTEKLERLRAALLAQARNLLPFYIAAGNHALIDSLLDLMAEIEGAGLGELRRGGTQIQTMLDHATRLLVTQGGRH